MCTIVPKLAHLYGEVGLLQFGCHQNVHHCARIAHLYDAIYHPCARFCMVQVVFFKPGLPEKVHDSSKIAHLYEAIDPLRARFSSKVTSLCEIAIYMVQLSPSYSSQILPLFVAKVVDFRFDLPQNAHHFTSTAPDYP